MHSACECTRSKKTGVSLLPYAQLVALVCVTDALPWSMGLLPLSSEAQPQQICFPSFRDAASASWYGPLHKFLLNAPRCIFCTLKRARERNTNMQVPYTTLHPFSWSAQSNTMNKYRVLMVVLAEQELRGRKKRIGICPNTASEEEETFLVFNFISSFRIKFAKF